MPKCTKCETTYELPGYRPIYEGHTLKRLIPCCPGCGDALHQTTRAKKAPAKPKKKKEVKKK